MELDSTATTTRELSRWVSIGVLLAAIVLGLGVLYHVNHSPRTDDAEVFANYIGIAPQVEGPIARLNVRDNQFVKRANCYTRLISDRISTRSRGLFRNRPPSKDKSLTSSGKSMHW